MVDWPSSPGFKAKIWSLVFLGLVGVLAGIGAFIYPGMTALVLLYFIAVWAIITGSSGHRHRDTPAQGDHG